MRFVFWDGIVHFFVKWSCICLWKALNINKCYLETIAERKVRDVFHQMNVFNLNKFAFLHFRLYLVNEIHSHIPKSETKDCTILAFNGHSFLFIEKKRLYLEMRKHWIISILFLYCWNCGSRGITVRAEMKSTERRRSMSA